MPPKQQKVEDLPRFWFPLPSEGYCLGEVLHEDAGDNLHVRLQLPEETKTANFHASVAKPVNPKILDGVHGESAPDRPAGCWRRLAAAALPLYACDSARPRPRRLHLRRRAACRRSQNGVRDNHSSFGNSSIGSSRMKRRQNQMVNAFATSNGSNQPITVQRGRPKSIRTGVSVSAAYAACEL